MTEPSTQAPKEATTEAPGEAPTESPAVLSSWSPIAIAQNLAAIAIIGGFAVYVWSHREVLLESLDFSFVDLSIVGGTVVLTWIATSLQGWVLYRAESLEIGIVENFLLTVTGAAANYLPLRMGTVIRFRYLKAVHGLRYTRSVSIASIRLTLLVVATGALGLVGVGGIWFSTGNLALELAGMFSALLLVASIAARRGAPVSKAEGRFVRIWKDFSAGFSVIRERPRVGLQVFGLILAQLVLIAIRFDVALRIVGTNASVNTLLTLAPTATLASFVSIVPGGLGLREGVMGYVTLATGLSFDSGLFAGTIDRAVLLVLLISTGSLSLLYIWVKLRRAERGA
jgi:uncharacterized membrane protein YbhN (UPF0104 family)